MSHIEIIHLIDSYVLLATHIISLIIVCRKWLPTSLDAPNPRLIQIALPQRRVKLRV